MSAYKGFNAWYLLHPKELFISSKFAKEFHSKKELEKYCKVNKIEFEVIDVLQIIPLWGFSFCLITDITPKHNPIQSKNNC